MFRYVSTWINHRTQHSQATRRRNIQTTNELQKEENEHPKHFIKNIDNSLTIKKNSIICGEEHVSRFTIES